MEHQPLSKSTIFVVGDMVVVHGLQGRVELNGQTGTLLSFDAGKGRWAIHLAAETISIKPGTIDILHQIYFAPLLTMCSYTNCHRQLSQDGSD